ncbi:hypothetical protein GALMADRAFT_216142 [Galerina marginata CBS 339.88]|uniref:Uncharacterized protein n=1 Tax=Galerina marginata (strain CBS 339.88) TaxID=685588 RepID=A0A067SK01_GALM3|nr:hypothetical protein GALMADRAFT_216142 [Galerina marginata CBS 339.88]
MTIVVERGAGIPMALVVLVRVRCRGDVESGSCADVRALSWFRSAHGTRYCNREYMLRDLMRSLGNTCQNPFGFRGSESELGGPMSYGPLSTCSWVGKEVASKIEWFEVNHAAGIAFIGSTDPHMANAGDE